MIDLPEASRPTSARVRAVALALFAERGYAGTSIAEIAIRVGVRKPTLYNYFRSKEELLLGLVEESLGAWAAASRPPWKEEGPLRDRLLGHLAAALAFAAEHPHELAILRVASTQVAGELGVRIGALLDEQKGRYLMRVEQVIGEAAARGEIRADLDPRELCVAWRAFADGLILDRLFPLGSGAGSAPDVQRVFEVFWGGMAAGGGKPARVGIRKGRDRADRRPALARRRPGARGAEESAAGRGTEE